MDEFFSRINIDDESVFVDVGCGRGRVLNYWIRKFPRNKIYGIELDNEIAKQTSNRLKKYDNCNVISGSAIDCFPEDGTVFYLFNPFSDEVLVGFISKFKEAMSDGKERVIV